ncbi:uncharacterized protein LOC111385656, partial [Olea europaea var. sylvestris]|uniref:uncharacterized protein LOC111385656 n=1 Tax=Olea europaea var. sylvestris TaxID=158386 RepID=UPI000C1D4AAC
SAHFHTNIRRARSSSDVNNYISKYGDFIEDGSFKIDGRSARGCPSTVAEVYAEALNAISKTNAMRIIKEKDPKSYVIQRHNISANLDKEFPTPMRRYISPYNPNSLDELRQWSIENISEDATARPDRPKSIFIEGHSYLGKTV